MCEQQMKTATGEHPGYVVHCMALDMLKACVRRTGAEAAWLVITKDMAGLLWGFYKTQNAHRDLTREEWLQHPKMLGLPVCIGKNFEVHGVDDAGPTRIPKKD